MEYSVSSVLSLISRIHSKSQNFLHKKMAENGLPDLATSHGFILFCLSKGALSFSELTEKINRDKSTTTALVKKLENLGLVEIHVCASDSRRKFVSLTEKGRAYNETTSALSQELLTTAYRGLTDEEAETLLSLLVRLSQNISDDRDFP